MISDDLIQAIHKKRKVDTLANAVSDKDGDILILTSPSDIGVCRNGGRRGSCFAPNALMTVFLKCTLPADHLSSIPKLQITPVSSMAQEKASFGQGQIETRKNISHACKNFSGQTLLHLGGGHDHIFPFLSALEENFSYKRLVVINIDAHLDTRTDNFAHSGTPFRQFAETTQRDFALYQVGIHPYSNGGANYTPLPTGTMVLLPQQDPLSSLQEKVRLDADDLYMLSLDCDALHASYMEAVSAVNHQGMDLTTLQSIFHWYKSITKKQTSLIGIYEYNPLYDNLSQKGARAIAATLYQYIFSAPAK